MKKMIILLLLLLLAACAGPSTEPAAPSSSATAIEPLQVATPSSTATTASPTPIPASPTPMPAATSTPAPEPEDIPKENLEETGEPVIIFHQEGGFAGVDLTWTIYDNGLIVTPEGEELSVDPATVDELLEIIEETGFFELVQPKPSNICCDFFTFTLAVSYGDQKNVITYNDGDPNKPAGLSEAVTAVQQTIAQL